MTPRPELRALQAIISFIISADVNILPSLIYPWNKYLYHAIRHFMEWVFSTPTTTTPASRVQAVSKKSTMEKEFRSSVV